MTEPRFTPSAVIEAFSRGLVVSCQARVDNPLHGPEFMGPVAHAAELGGAVGIRAEGAADIAAVRVHTGLPIIGIRKDFNNGPLYITPTLEAAVEIRDAGADIIALDATNRSRPHGVTAAQLIEDVRRDCERPVMADIDDEATGIAAADAGAELIATTLSGYTGGEVPAEADYALIERLANRGLTVVAEGRLRTADDARRAFDAGAHAVVIGTAITNPWRITERIVRNMHEDAPQ